MEQDNDSTDERFSRLGIDYELDGDTNHVERLEKKFRVIGLTLVIVFVLWGLISNWSRSNSPFESLAQYFGASYNKEEAWAYIIAAASFTMGTYLRFDIGALSSLLLLKIWAFIKSMFKHI